MLPELKDVSVIQSTRLTNGKYPYNLLHQKIFSFVIFQLQEQIRRIAKGEKIDRLSLFQTPTDLITVDLPMYYIGEPNQYPAVRKATEEMCKILVVMRDPEKKERTVSGLFSAIKSLDQGKRSNQLTIEIRKDVAHLLMHIDYNHYYKSPANYTQFLIQVVHQSKNKYTTPIYKLISSWKVKGGFQIPLQKLKEQLGIEDKKYANYAHFKRSILLPVQEELKEFGDCWFNVADNDFEIMKDKKVTMLNFKVISHSSEKLLAMKIQQCKDYIKIQFDMSPGYMEKLDVIFSGTPPVQNILDKARDLAIRVKEDKKRTIKNVQAWVYKSLTALFATE